ncbi:MAG: hypothetical protein QOI83_3721, partial [Streptomycetaceae bacterium]|nr:hypothetical protein [Streptomycetaceae bacterium]
VANVRTFWDVFITVLLKCVAALGFAVPSRSPLPAPFPAPAPAAPRAEVTGGGVMVCPSGQPSEPVRDRSLPPTMKQRIHAEAHGASPRARSMPGEIADAVPAVKTAAQGPIPSPRRSARPLYA